MPLLISERISSAKPLVSGTAERRRLAVVPMSLTGETREFYISGHTIGHSTSDSYADRQNCLSQLLTEVDFNLSYPARIRTWTKRSKVSCATVTPPGKKSQSGAD
jgi:hypothetical protein